MGQPTRLGLVVYMQWNNNNNNEYLEHLTRTGPKCLHVLYKYILSKFNAYNMIAHTHTHAHTHTLAHACTMNAPDVSQSNRDWMSNGDWISYDFLRVANE